MGGAIEEEEAGLLEDFVGTVEAETEEVEEVADAVVMMVVDAVVDAVGMMVDEEEEGEEEEEGDAGVSTPIQSSASEFFPYSVRLLWVVRPLTSGIS